MAPIRLVHYLNQFFAGAGGEKEADRAPEVRAGPVGPGIPLQGLLGGEAEIVATVYCGDNYVHAKGQTAVEEILALVARADPAAMVAGPAFDSGRYGMACGLVAQAAEERLKVPAVVAMSPENPAVDLYRRYVPIVPTDTSPARMRAILAAIAPLVLKRGRGEPLGSPDEDGYLPRGIRKNVLESRSAAERAVQLLLVKLAGGSYRTEIPFPEEGTFVAAPPLRDAASATIALVTCGGIVTKGNPDRIEARRASRWSRFSVAHLDDLTFDNFECVHGGYDTAVVVADPDRLLPVDAMRRLEREGKIGRLHEYCYSTVGAGALIERGRRFGREIGEQLLAAGVQAVIMTAT